MSRLLKYVDPNRIGECVEVGCGAGVHAEDFPGWVGLDLSTNALMKTNNHLPRVRAIAEVLPLKQSCLNLLLAFNLIEHLYRPESFLNEAFRVLKNQGYLVIDSPNITGRVLIPWLISETLWVLLRKIGCRRRLRPKFGIADYSSIGNDADAVYKVNLFDLMPFLADRGFEIVNSEPWRKFMWWVRTIHEKKHPFIVARVTKS